jgi:hypothetical protein
MTMKIDGLNQIYQMKNVTTDEASENIKNENVVEIKLF